MALFGPMTKAFGRLAALAASAVVIGGGLLAAEPPLQPIPQIKPLEIAPFPRLEPPQPTAPASPAADEAAYFVTIEAEARVFPLDGIGPEHVLSGTAIEPGGWRARVRNGPATVTLRLVPTDQGKTSLPLAAWENDEKRIRERLGIEGPDYLSPIFRGLGPWTERIADQKRRLANSPAARTKREALIRAAEDLTSDIEAMERVLGGLSDYGVDPNGATSAFRGEERQRVLVATDGKTLFEERVSNAPGWGTSPLPLDPAQAATARLTVWHFDPADMTRVGDLAAGFYGRRPALSNPGDQEVGDWFANYLEDGLRRIVREAWRLSPAPPPAELAEPSGQVPGHYRLAETAQLSLPPIGTPYLIRLDLPWSPFDVLPVSPIHRVNGREVSQNPDRDPGGELGSLAFVGTNRLAFQAPDRAAASASNLTGGPILSEAHPGFLYLTAQSADGSASGDMIGSKQEKGHRHETRLTWRIVGADDRDEPETVDFVTDPPGFRLAAAHAPETAEPGDEATLGLRLIRLPGPPGHDVRLDIDLSDRLTREPVSGFEVSGGACQADGPGHFSCRLGTMAPGTAADVLLTGILPKGGLAWTAAWDTAEGVAGLPIAKGGVSLPPPPVIIDAITVEDQMGVENGIFKYAYPVGPNANVGRSRHLLVVGRNLPKRDFATVSADPGLKYLVLATEDTRNVSYADTLAAGWARYRSQAPSDDAPSGLEALLVRVDLADGILPGQKVFLLNGLEVPWNLQFGDVTLEVGFARRGGARGLEAIDTAYLPEGIVVTARLTPPLPIDAVPLRLARSTGEPTDEDAIDIVARRDPALGDGVYVSSTIEVGKGDGLPSETAIQFAAKSVDAEGRAGLSAKVEDGFRETFLLPVHPAVARIDVAASPHAGTYSRGFKEALRRAAICHSIPIQDWDAVAFEKVDEVTNLVVLKSLFGANDHVLKQDIKLGHQAAMILMRDMFLSLMETGRKDLRGMAGTDEGVLDFLLGMHRRWQGRYFGLTPSAIDIIKVKDPAGNDIPYSLVVLDDIGSLAKRYGKTSKEIVAWQIAQTGTALKDLIKAARDTITFTKAVKDCDVDGLMALTTRHFEPVRRRLIPHLVRLQDQPGSQGIPGRRWLPDTEARRWLNDLTPLVERIAKQKEIATSDSLALTPIAAVAGVIAAGPLMASHGTASLTVQLVFDIADMVSVYAAYNDFLAIGKEYDFARGATLALGTRRYDEAEARAKDWMAHFQKAVDVAIGTQVPFPGVPLAALKHLPSPTLLARLAKGRLLAVRGDGLPPTSRSIADSRDYWLFAARAKIRSIADGGGALDAVERQTLAALESKVPTAPASPPRRRLADPDLSPSQIASMKKRGGNTGPEPVERSAPASSPTSGAATERLTLEMPDHVDPAHLSRLGNHDADLIVVDRPSPSSKPTISPPVETPYDSVATYVGTARGPPPGLTAGPPGQRTSGGQAGASPTPPQENSLYRFRDALTGETVEVRLGTQLGPGHGFSSKVFSESSRPLVNRFTSYLGDNPIAPLLDRVGEKIVDRLGSRHVRTAKIEREYEIRDGSGQAAYRVTRVERLAETAEQTISRQGGKWTSAQEEAFRGTLRDLNDAGFAWLDCKTNNFAFVDEMGRTRLVVFDAGGIVPVRSPEQAKSIQRMISGRFEDVFPTVSNIKTERTRVMVRVSEVRDLYINENVLDLKVLGLTPGDLRHLHFNPRAGERVSAGWSLFPAEAASITR